MQELNVLNSAKTPPFTIEDQTDGGDDLRMQYRYLDIRRNPGSIGITYYDGEFWNYMDCHYY